MLIWLYMGLLRTGNAETGEVQGSFLPYLILGLHLHVTHPVKQGTLLEEDQFTCWLIVWYLGEVCHLVLLAA